MFCNNSHLAFYFCHLMRWCTWEVQQCHCFIFYKTFTCTIAADSGYAVGKNQCVWWEFSSQNICDYFTKLSKVAASVESLTPEFFSYFWCDCRSFCFKWPARKTFLISNFLRSLDIESFCVLLRNSYFQSVSVEVKGNYAKKWKNCEIYCDGFYRFLFWYFTIIHGELKFIPFNVINSLVTYEDTVT